MYEARSGRQTQNVLDGHHRVKICAELSVPCPRVVRTGFADEAAKRTHARRLNIARRHLTGEQKRALIADELRDDPERSNRQIAAALGVSHETVRAVRGDMEATDQIGQLERTTGADGKSRPAKKSARPKPIRYDFDGDEEGQKALRRSASDVATKKREAKRGEIIAKLEDTKAKQAKEACACCRDMPMPSSVAA